MIVGKFIASASINVGGGRGCAMLVVMKKLWEKPGKLNHIHFLRRHHATPEMLGAINCRLPERAMMEQ